MPTESIDAEMFCTWTRLLMTSAGKIAIHSEAPPTAPATLRWNIFVEATVFSSSSITYIVLRAPISSFDWLGLECEKINLSPQFDAQFILLCQNFSGQLVSAEEEKVSRHLTRKGRRQASEHSLDALVPQNLPRQLIRWHPFDLLHLVESLELAFDQLGRTECEWWEEGRKEAGSGIAQQRNVFDIRLALERLRNEFLAYAVS